jgi:plasmid stabilization system protein ParE
MAARAKLLFTENFAANLDTIQSFLEPEGRSAFQRLLSRLFDDICPTLSRFPQSGRSFLAHHIGSAEAQIVVDRLGGLVHHGDELREFTVDDYIILYLVRRRRIYLLAIKHHRQLSFDLRRFWP